MEHPRFRWTPKALHGSRSTRVCDGSQRLRAHSVVPAFALDTKGSARILWHPRLCWTPKAVRAIRGTRVSIGSQRLCAHFVVPAFVLDPKGSTEIMEHPRSHGPRAECNGIAREALRGKRCNCFNLVRFCPPARPLGTRDFWEVWQQRLINSYARKYSMFLQHLHVTMCLPICVAIVDY